MKMKFFILVFVLLMVTGCTGNIKEGVALLEENKYQEAKEIFEKDIQKERNLDEAYRGIGIACFELEEYEQAVEYFNLALANEAEETAIILSLLGASHMELAQYQEAEAAYKKALGKEDITETQKQEIMHNLIAVYEYMGDWEAAKKQMQDYQKAYPEDTGVENEAGFLGTR